MKRSFLIAVLGYCLGILWGIYVERISFLVVIIVSILIWWYTKQRKRKNKYIRLLYKKIKDSSIVLFLILSFMGYVKIKDKIAQYDWLYEQDNINLYIGTIMSEGKENGKDVQYLIEIEAINEKKVKSRMYLRSKQKLNYGDKLIVRGEYIPPEVQRNDKGFDYREYLRTKGISGTIKETEKGKVIGRNTVKGFSKLTFQIRTKMIKNIETSFKKEEVKQLLIGILLGDNSQIPKEVKEDFKNSSLSHILAISGTHISILILAITFILKIGNIRKIIRNITICILLLLFLEIIGMTPSVTRACIMSILVLVANICHRKSDLINNMSLTLLISLWINPFQIQNIGLILSYGGVICIAFGKKEKTEEKQELTQTIKDKVKKSIFLSCKIYMIMLPILISLTHTISFTFWLSNLMITPFVSIVLIGGMIFLMGSICFPFLTSITVLFLNKVIEVMLQLIRVCANFPFSKQYIIIPPIYIIMIYEVWILGYYFFPYIKKSRRLSQFFSRCWKRIVIVTMVIILLGKVISILPPKMKINFIDVGQGDCTLIRTPYHKTILIDGGGNVSNSSYDIGKEVLLPYLSNHQITKIDLIVISHFDTDHVGGILSILEKVKVEKVIISKQGEDSENYQRFLELVKEKKIKIFIVRKGDRITIEDNLYIDILWPHNEQIAENILNNNSIVMKVWYGNFSILFTGDIEDIAEKAILEKYKNTNRLKSTILKVAHHGSKSSSIQEMIEAINPKIALIGVGVNNTFGHPNEEVLKRFRNLRYKDL